MIKFVLVVLILSACVPLITPTPEPAPVCETEVAYYRGVYTLCMALNAQALQGGATRFIDCNVLVRNGYRLKWHEREAPGFEWPPEVVPEPTPGPAGDAL